LTNLDLAKSYLKKATDRLDILELLINKRAYSDVVREAQEIVELALKGMLRAVGVEPPKLHDVGGMLLEHKERLPEDVCGRLGELAAVSKWLRKEREFSFYGDIDFIPTEEYIAEDATRAMAGAKLAVKMAARVIGVGRV